MNDTMDAVLKEYTERHDRMYDLLKTLANDLAKENPSVGVVLLTLCAMMAVYEEKELAGYLLEFNKQKLIQLRVRREAATKEEK